MKNLPGHVFYALLVAAGTVMITTITYFATYYGLTPLLQKTVASFM